MRPFPSRFSRKLSTSTEAVRDYLLQCPPPPHPLYFIVINNWQQIKELLPTYILLVYVGCFWQIGLQLSVSWTSDIDLPFCRNTHFFEENWAISVALRGIKLSFTELSWLFCIFLKVFSIGSYLSSPSLFCVLSFWKSSTHVKALSFYMCKELREGKVFSGTTL